SRLSILVIFITGLIIIIYPHLAQQYHAYSQKTTVNEFFETELSEFNEQEIEEISEIASECNESVFNNAAAFRDPFDENTENIDQYEQCFNLLEDEMFAAIEIPKLNLLIPIYLGATDEILNQGIGQVAGSSIPIGGESTHSVL